jgi:predicted nuclease of predicted toxin-antitoxin system
MRRILIDECLNPRLASRLRALLSGDTVETIRDLGWAGQQDHILVPQIQGRFDVFLTIDKGFEFEHNLEELSFGIIILEAANNQMASYERLLERLVEQVRVAAPGRVARVRDPGL